MKKYKGAQQGNRNAQRYTRELVVEKLNSVVTAMCEGFGYTPKHKAYEIAGLKRNTLWDWINRTWKHDEEIQDLYRWINEVADYEIVEAVMMGQLSIVKATWIQNRWYGKEITYPWGTLESRSPRVKEVLKRKGLL